MSRAQKPTNCLGISGPDALPLLSWRGNLLRFAHKPVFFMDKLHQEYGKIVTAARETNKVIFVFGPEYNQQILKNPEQYHSYDLRTSPLPFPQESELMKMNTGLSLLNGQSHKRIRRLMLPFFQKKHFNAYHRNMVALTDKLLVQWIPGRTLNLFKELESIALWLSVKTLFGLDPDSRGLALVQILEDTMATLFSLPLLILPFNVPGLPFWHLIKQANLLSSQVQDLIARKREYNASTDDILSHLLLLHDRDNSQLSEDELIGQVITLFRGSYPTTAAAMTWTLLLLSKHPDVLSALLDELDQVLSKSPPTVEQLSQLTLLEDVIKESMRLLAPTPWVIRFNTAPTKLGTYEFVERTTFVLGIFVTQRLPELYDEPRRFLPQRWQKINRSPYEYLPFIAGPRMCIGASFALMLMKIVLSMLLQRYSFSFLPGMKVNVAGVRGLIPAGGVPILLSESGLIPPQTDISGNINKLIDW